MRLLSVVDATPATGLGRLARTLAVGEALVAAGHEHVLAGTLDLPGAATLTDEAGVAVHGTARTAEEVQELAERHRADWVLLDQARPPAGVTDRLAAAGIRSAAFDDRPDPAGLRSNPPRADLVVVPQWSATSSVRTSAEGTRVARGPDFAPVRAAAREAKERRRARAGGMGDRPRLLVLLGEGPAADTMTAVAEWLAGSDVTADVLCVGGDRAQRRRAEVQSTRRVRVLATAWRSDLPRLVADHDLVVSFGPRFTWEVACIGTPMALLATGDAPAAPLEAAAAAGAAIWLGRPGDDHSPAGRLRLAVRDAIRRLDVAAQAARLVDGAGADRIVELMAAGAG